MAQHRTRLSGVDDIQARAPRIGKLKIGEVVEKTNNKGEKYTHPVRLDHVVAKDGAGNIVQAFHDVYGEKPIEFLAVFPSNDPSQWYWEAYRRYGSGTGLACHGDGRQAIEEATGEALECPCPYAEPTVKTVNGVDKQYPPACKIVATVGLFLYEVPELGIFQIETGSFRSMSNLKWFIREGLPSLSGGQLAGIPMRVYIEEFQAVHDGHASTAYQWKFGLAPGMRPQDVQIAARQAVAGFCLPAGVGQPALDEGKPEDLYPGIPAVTGGQPEASEPAETVEVKATETFEEATKTFEVGVPGEVVEAELVYKAKLTAALKGHGITEAKHQDAIAVMEANRKQAEPAGQWGGYLHWLGSATKRIPGAAA